MTFDFPSIGPANVEIERLREELKALGVEIPREFDGRFFNIGEANSRIVGMRKMLDRRRGTKATVAPRVTPCPVAHPMRQQEVTIIPVASASRSTPAPRHFTDDQWVAELWGQYHEIEDPKDRAKFYDANPELHPHRKNT